ncbi:hypothetical protein FRC02_008116 [Tulasnella sp. 418]|nr:hypothetical protein FRC02_008116 [Tulasnella sp. 418]
MDIFGTVGTAIDLVCKIKAAFDQVDQNKDECSLLSDDILTSLSRLKEFLEDNNSSLPDRLRKDLSEFETELKASNVALSSLFKPRADGFMADTIATVRELYNVDDIKCELNIIRRKVESCYQRLQMWGTFRIEAEVSRMKEQLGELVAMLQQQSPNHLPAEGGSNENPEQSETIGQIEEQPLGSKTEVQTVDSQQALLQFQSHKSQATPSVKSSRLSIRSLTPSIIAITERVKAISNAIPLVRDQVLRQSYFTPWWNQFRELEAMPPNMCRDDAITKAIQVLKILQSEKKIPYIDVAKDLLHLGGTLRVLKMPDQADIMYGWGVKICCELSVRGSSRTLVDLAQLLHKLAFNLSIAEQFDDAERLFKQAIQVRCRLQHKEQRIFKLASSLGAITSQLRDMLHFNVCCVAGQEVVEIYRNLANINRETYLVQLSQSLHDLAFYLDKKGKTAEAVVVGEEAVELRRELVQRERKAHLADFGLSVHQLALYLVKIGKLDRVTTSTAEQAVGIYRELVEMDPSLHLLGLSASLHNLALFLSSIERLDYAVTVEADAVKIGRELVKKDRKAYLPDLCLCVRNLAYYLDNAGRSDEAIKAGREATDIYQELVQTDPDTYIFQFIACLEYLTELLTDLGMHEEAGRVESKISQIRQNQRPLAGDSDSSPLAKS